MKLLRSTGNKTTKDKNGENVPHLEITEVVFIVILSIMIINKIRESCTRLFQINRGVVVINTAQLHSTKPELKLCAGSNPARGMSEILDGEDL